MNVDGVKVTWIAAGEEIEQRDRPNFRPVCAYGTIQPERNEVGCIAKAQRGAKHRATHVPGIYAIDVDVLERIFIVEPE